MALLEVAGISKLENEKYTVKDISFAQQPSQKIAIAGETGSGKTTLLKMIAGLIQPDAGAIYFEDKKVLGPFEKLLPGHPSIAFLSQHFELRNNYRVEEELESKNLLDADEAKNIYSICGITHLLKRKTNQLSGGERQRIVLARLLTTSPKLLLLDEPFSNLDAAHKNVIKSVINDVVAKLNVACIMVSHDGLDTLSWADTVFVMKEGRIIQHGSPEKIYHQPLNEYCAGLFGEYNLISNKNSLLFETFAEGKEKGRKILIRPEDFEFVSPENSLINGIVQQVSFWGSYYTIDVIIDNELIRVKLKNRQFEKGDNVSLTSDPSKWWYL